MYYILWYCWLLLLLLLLYNYNNIFIIIIENGLFLFYFSKWCDLAVSLSSLWIFIFVINSFGF